MSALERLCRWRTVLTAWQLGTQPTAKQDHTFEAVRDHREITLNLRAEMDTLCVLMVKKGIFTQSEFMEELERQAERLDKVHEQRYPGFKMTDEGIDINESVAAQTTVDWKS